MFPVLIGIGSNIDKEANVTRLLNRLAADANWRLVAYSRIYETVALNIHGLPADQPSFYNLAAHLETALGVSELRDYLRKIEVDFGRIRSSDKFAARPIDLDIIYYGNEPTAVDGKYYPDHDLAHFPHLVCPLAEVAPLWPLPSIQNDAPHPVDRSSPRSRTLQEQANHLLKDEKMAAQILRIVNSAQKFNKS